jgi:hypothetical protein
MHPATAVDRCLGLYAVPRDVEGVTDREIAT